jgi:Trk K+ transport system NAD-binding subunit
MSDVLYLIMRRMRAPLIALIVIFASCTAGLALTPGNPDPVTGENTYLTFFDALYVISYTATTIGFGEIPQPFSTAQRMWMTLSIYVSVIGWYYALVTMVALVTEGTFQRALRMGRFTKRIQGLREAFYIICGAGETGTLICQGLDRLGHRFVVIEQADTVLQQLRLVEFRSDAPMIVADAAQPTVLTSAGLLSPHCRGVIAVVDDDDANQAIAVTTRLLAPRVPVLARIRDARTETHIGVFGGDLVINPFERFAEQLGAAVATPQRYRLREILTGLEGDPLPDEYHPPRGHWIMCGYGRFGHAMAMELRAAGNTVAIIDQENFESGGVDVYGTGADSDSLQAAGLDKAVGLVAGNASDTKNLAIAVAARDLKPELFIVTRQNQTANLPLFDAFTDDMAMVPSRIVASEFLARITTPLLVRFLNRLPLRSEEDCAALTARLVEVHQGRIPIIWSVVLDTKHAAAAVEYLTDGGVLTLGQLKSPFRIGEPELSAEVLLVARARRVIEQPSDDFNLAVGDEILVASDSRSMRWIPLRLMSAGQLESTINTNLTRGGYIWRWLTQRTKSASSPPRNDRALN